MDKIILLLTQRRVWAGILGALAFIATTFNIQYQIDVEQITTLITNVFIALSALISGVLALWSYFKPKK